MAFFYFWALTMRAKKFSTLLQVRISTNDKARLVREAERLGVCEATLARLSLREGLHRIRAKLLPVAEEKAAS